MKEIILALLGGGAIVQVANIFATLRPSRRRMHADARGLEVNALEKTIVVLQENFERENERHRQEVAALRCEIDSLRSELVSLRSRYEPGGSVSHGGHKR